MPVIIIVNVLNNHSTNNAGKKGRKIKIVYNPDYRKNYYAHNPMMQVYFPFSVIQKYGINSAIMNKKVAKKPTKNIANYYTHCK